VNEEGWGGGGGRRGAGRAGTGLQSRLIYLIASPGLQPGFNASPSGRSRSVKTKREAGAKGARVGQMRGGKEQERLDRFPLVLTLPRLDAAAAARVKFPENNFHFHLRCRLPLSSSSPPPLLLLLVSSSLVSVCALLPASVTVCLSFPPPSPLPLP
jgi:hypothetical protein